MAWPDAGAPGLPGVTQGSGAGRPLRRGGPGWSGGGGGRSEPVSPGRLRRRGEGGVCRPGGDRGVGEGTLPPRGERPTAGPGPRPRPPPRGGLGPAVPEGGSDPFNQRAGGEGAAPFRVRQPTRDTRVSELAARETRVTYRAGALKAPTPGPVAAAATEPRRLPGPIGRRSWSVTRKVQMQSRGSCCRFLPAHRTHLGPPPTAQDAPPTPCSGPAESWCPQRPPAPVRRPRGPCCFALGTTGARPGAEGARALGGSIGLQAEEQGPCHLPGGRSHLCSQVRGSSGGETECALGGSTHRRWRAGCRPGLPSLPRPTVSLGSGTCLGRPRPPSAVPLPPGGPALRSGSPHPSVALRASPGAPAELIC
ncbi:collagen alpha-1(VII) chain-like [Pan troglodytes]|uniref:collagen alpha-1(VII) chain-like n=1 Tax=Pan troglodytes TaxID=9598 RepID=UPI0007DBB816|nr:collagen alpha-1(VII) chain-like [Pan troglodytes]XP_016784604.1 collagen alpha-1(VII) chain-like [Pan troglodytes]XP_054524588.1 collagen alpha-1(VII) chain-like [Pan troglodytes]XP_054524589.1 collagen alpha-1(VII) chain-like [Pan troglodytes]XP_054524590.1 collagen alpha-1(VII) chain-like [Pan troglodytes]XP_054524591.1 collagen alpha-1(VII) chain-like [Pan troglodytes]XP_054524592.1 collagen alpha-1(VII) chain-like [Pan troglodytes]